MKAPVRDSAGEMKTYDFEKDESERAREREEKRGGHPFRHSRDHVSRNDFSSLEIRIERDSRLLLAVRGIRDEAKFCVINLNGMKYSSRFFSSSYRLKIPNSNSKFVTYLFIYLIFYHDTIWFILRSLLLLSLLN